ncbi:MAG: aldo/keto reductase, partial [Candidatus Omnitrophica bacterium]|nr:aldo/keto reductase [Candidatus Omnitrophota bacterium]
KNTDILVSEFGLGTWAFGEDASWGEQNATKSDEVMQTSLDKGVNLFDTAPIYGRGRSEEVIGKFIKNRGVRENVIIATKLGLSWKGPEVYHDLNKKRMLEEIDRSLKRLNVEYIDIYQIHRPDEKIPVEKYAEVMLRFLKEKKIKAVGVSNFSTEQMKLFLKVCPIHSLQPQYSMFNREIEEDILPFCMENDIYVLSYGTLHGGILSGKFNLENKPKPKDWARNNFYFNLDEPVFSINTEFFTELKKIADKYRKTLSQLVIKWTISKDGIGSVLIGCRDSEQVNYNLGGFDCDISQEDKQKIENILRDRSERLVNS